MDVRGRFRYLWVVFVTDFNITAALNLYLPLFLERPYLHTSASKYCRHALLWFVI